MTTAAPSPPWGHARQGGKHAAAGALIFGEAAVVVGQLVAASSRWKVFWGLLCRWRAGAFFVGKILVGAVDTCGCLFPKKWRPVAAVSALYGSPLWWAFFAGLSGNLGRLCTVDGMLWPSAMVLCL